MSDGRLAELRQLYDRGLLSKETYEAASAALSVEVGSGAGVIRHGNIGNIVTGQGATVTVNPPPAANWKEQYLRALLGYCNQIDVTAVDERVIEGEPVQLPDVFTSLLVELSKRPLTRIKQQSVAQALQQWLKGGHEPSDKDKIAISAVEAIAALPKVVILAYPGGGKSTLVNYVASQLAHKELGKPVDFPGWPADTPPLLPIRVILLLIDRSARFVKSFIISCYELSRWLRCLLHRHFNFLAHSGDGPGQTGRDPLYPFDPR